MVFDLLFLTIFIFGVFYLIRYQVNLKRAAEISQHALFPKTEREFASVLIPAEWKEMEPLTKSTKSYLYVKWGTAAALLLVTILLGVSLVTDWFETSLFSFVYFFFVIIRAIPHRGNLFIFQEGLILNGRYYSNNQIRSYEVEEVVRWHELYGLDDRVNYGYKLTFHVKKLRLLEANYVVVAEQEHLDRILRLLNGQGISGGLTPVKVNEQDSKEHALDKNKAGVPSR